MALALGVQALLGTQGTVTLGCGQLLRRPHPGLVLPGQHLPFPGRVIAGLPGLLPGIGFSLPGAGQFSLGGTNRRRGLLTSLIAFRPGGLSDPGGLGDRGLRIGAGTGNLPGQLPADLRGLLTGAAGPGLGGLPAAMGGLRRIQCREHLLLSLGGTRLGGDRTRLGAAPGGFGLRQLRGHHLGVQRRDPPARQHDQRARLPDKRLQRTERVITSLPG